MSAVKHLLHPARIQAMARELLLIIVIEDEARNGRG